MIVSVLSQLAVLFLMVGAGYLLARKRLVSERFQSDLTQLVLYVALPCAVVESGVLETGEAGLSSILWMTGLSVASYSAVILISEGVRCALRMPDERGGLFACMIVFANTAFVGYPVCSLLLGSKGVFYASFFNMVFNLFFFTYGVRRIGRRKAGSVKEVLCDPGMVATAVMLAIFAFQWRPPTVLKTFLSCMSALCTPLSMMIIGCMMTGVDLRAMLREKSYWLVSVMRLLAIPALAMLCAGFLADSGVDKDSLFVIIIMCAMPAGSLSAIYAEKSGQDAAYVSGGIVYTMIGFCVSLPLIVLGARLLLYSGG